jgi:hypothetical protein
MEITVGHGHLSIPIRRFSVRGNLAPLANGAPQYPPVGSSDLDLPDLLLIQRRRWEKSVTDRLETSILRSRETADPGKYKKIDFLPVTGNPYFLSINFTFVTILSENQ